MTTSIIPVWCNRPCYEHTAYSITTGELTRYGVYRCTCTCTSYRYSVQARARDEIWSQISRIKTDCARRSSTSSGQIQVQPRYELTKYFHRIGEARWWSLQSVPLNPYGILVLSHYITPTGPSCSWGPKSTLLRDIIPWLIYSWRWSWTWYDDKSLEVIHIKQTQRIIIASRSFVWSTGPGGGNEFWSAVSFPLEKWAEAKSNGKVSWPFWVCF